MRIIFATNNSNKLKEIKEAVPQSIEVIGLAEAGFVGDIPEDHDTLEANASQKSHFLHAKLSENCFSDDTGLEIEALNGEPGVYSARYAGPDCDSHDNMEKVLDRMRGLANRKAQFRTVVSLLLDGKEHQFEGIAEGTIREEKSGAEGFGYDPIFEPDGYDVTFAELSMHDKNKISHRGKAVRSLIEFLSSL